MKSTQMNGNGYYGFVDDGVGIYRWNRPRNQALMDPNKKEIDEDMNTKSIGVWDGS